MLFRCFCAAMALSFAAASAGAGEVEILRDKWGVAHIYGPTEEAAFFGAGYATAGDRMLQMELRRLMVLGRLAEYYGRGEKEKFVQSDRLYRTLNLRRCAEAEMDKMGKEERQLLRAYAAGVNKYLGDNKGKLSPLFDRIGGHPRPWSAEDSLSLWIQRTVGFSPAWKEEVKAKREYEKDPAAWLASERTKRIAGHQEDPLAIVSEEEFRRSKPKAYHDLKKIARSRRPEAMAPDAVTSASRAASGGPEAPKASHNWAVGTSRSKTGSAILEGDPQLTVQNPNTMYEVHISGGRYNVRGGAYPGVPCMLIGFNEHVAWAATALNSDQGDLFEEKVNPANPNQYLWKGEWENFDARTETIRVKGGDPIVFEVRSTRHGPVVNDLIEGVKPGETFALQMVFFRPDGSSVGSNLKMMRATDWKSWRGALRGYQGPGAHLIYADAKGNIGYQATVRIPRRPHILSLPREGWTGEEEWDMLPFDWLPGMLNPRNGCVYTANGLPTGAWHPFAVSNGYGAGPRTNRLTEIFAGSEKFSPEDFASQVHRDTVVTLVRDFAALFLAVVEEDGAKNEAVAEAAEMLRNWNGQMRTDAPNYPAALAALGVILKTVNPEWLLGYGGQWGGVTAMLRDSMAEYRKTGRAPADPKVRQWLLSSAEQAMKDPTVKNPTWSPEGAVNTMPYQDNSSFGSLAPEFDMKTPPLKAVSLHTLWSQVGATYSQIVDFSDLDKSVAMSPPGISENPASPHHQDQRDFWATGSHRPAPITRGGVEAIRESSKTVSYRRK